MARIHDYEQVSELPKGALKFSIYAKERGFTTNYLYGLIRNVREGKKSWSDIGFEVILFQGGNWIVKN